jgi:hypothetical protein
MARNGVASGKWVGEAEYSADNYVCNPGQRCERRRLFATFCRDVYGPSRGFASVKFDVNLEASSSTRAPPDPDTPGGRTHHSARKESVAGDPFVFVIMD